MRCTRQVPFVCSTLLISTGPVPPAICIIIFFLVRLGTTLFPSGQILIFTWFTFYFLFTYLLPIHSSSSILNPLESISSSPLFFFFLSLPSGLYSSPQSPPFHVRGSAELSSFEPPERVRDSEQPHFVAFPSFPLSSSPASPSPHRFKVSALVRFIPSNLFRESPPLPISNPLSSSPISLTPSLSILSILLFILLPLPHSPHTPTIHYRGVNKHGASPE